MVGVDVHGDVSSGGDLAKGNGAVLERKEQKHSLTRSQCRDPETLSCPRKSLKGEKRSSHAREEEEEGERHFLSLQMF